MVDIVALQTNDSIENEEVNFWQMFHAVTVAIQKAAHSETAVYQAYNEQIKKLGLYSSICWVDKTNTILEVASIVPPRGVEFLLAKRPMVGVCFPLEKIPVTRDVLANGRAIYEADMVSLLFDGRLNPLMKLWPSAPRFLPHIPVIIAPLHRDGRIQGVLYLASRKIKPGNLDAVTALAHHLSIALDNARLFKALQKDIVQRQQSELVQSILYRIAAVANTNITLHELFASIHHILGDLMDVKNFYIATYDAQTNLISLPYFVDEQDKLVSPVPAGKGLTNYVIQTNKSHLLCAEDIRVLEEKNHLEVRGTMPLIWLGVPLSLQKGVIGIIAVQSYTDAQAYTEKDKQLLEFVSGQIATAVHRKQTETQLRTLAEELKQQAQIRDAILATTPDHFSVVDRDGRFLFLSALIEGIHTGINPQQIIGKTWQDLNIPPEIGRQGDRDRLTALETGQPVTRELKLTGPEGPMIVEYVISPVKEENGRIPYLVITARDITAKKQAAEAMYHTQKMESLGILAGGIAHDFNNLLAVMLAQTSLTLNKLPSNGEAVPHIQKAIQAAESAATLTQQLLAYSGHGQFHIKATNLNTLIQENIDLIRVTLNKNIDLRLNLGSNLPAIEADKGQVQQVIMNLVINAAEAIENKPGTITVKTEMLTLAAETLPAWKELGFSIEPGHFVKLTISDTGIGMDDTTIKRIFDPFFTTKFTGRGLGLAAILGIIHGHRGALRVSSQPGIGTTFAVIFPASTKSIQEKPAMSKSPPLNAQKLVLIIDDEKAVREAVTDILEIDGIGVLQAANGQEGIQLYQRHQENIGLILLDLSMPGLSGEDTMRELCRINAQVRILVSSGYAETDLAQRLNQSSYVGFLQKPYRMDTLLDVVARHFDNT